MYSLLMFVLTMAPAAKPAPVDLTYQQLGPCHRWEAHTKKGEEFLKAMPEKYRAPTVEPTEGKEKIVGRSEYDPKTKAIYASPSVLQQLKDLAEKDKLKVEEYDPYDEQQAEYTAFRNKILEAPVDGVTAGYLTVGPVDLYAGCLPHLRLAVARLPWREGIYECYKDGDKAYLRVITVPKPMPLAARKSLFPLLQHMR